MEPKYQHLGDASESGSEGHESQREDNETDDASESGHLFILCIMSSYLYERSL